MWNKQNDQLVKEFEFPDFSTALAFVNQVGEAAEAKNHHPDILFGWGKVKIMLTTHSAGGVTQQDHELAAQIDAITKQ